MIQKIVNFLNELYIWARSGFNLSNLFYERLSICEKCPEYNEQKMKCTVCGCNMLYKAKMKTSKCPLNKW